MVSDCDYANLSTAVDDVIVPNISSFPKLFPNPAQSQISLDSSQLHELIGNPFEMRSIFGIIHDKGIYEGQAFDISSLATGLYFLVIRQKGQ